MNDSVNPEILYIDSDLIIVNKPPGLLSIQDGFDRDLPHLRTILEPEFGKLWIVHRLDKETSGVMILARQAEAHRILNQEFRERQVSKIYHGLITPSPLWHQKEINQPLRVNADRKHRTRIDQGNGKPAHSSFTVEKHFQSGALAIISIKTGITHQIRAHVRALELSLLGDKLYRAGLTDQPFEVERTMLHARTVTFLHPTNKEWQQCTANYPQDFRQAYTKLRFTTETDVTI